MSTPAYTAYVRPVAASSNWRAISTSKSFLERPTGSLSAGQRTRVALAKALLNRPRLLLLDEPTASLDPDTGDVVRGYLEQYRKVSGATIVLASHNMAEVERLCDHVLMMRDGRIVDRGAPRQLISRYGRRTMEEVFLDIARNRSGGGRPRYEGRRVVSELGRQRGTMPSSRGGASARCCCGISMCCAVPGRGCSSWHTGRPFR